MSTNITRRRRTSQSSPWLIFEARLFKRQSKKRMAGVSSLTILSRISLLSHPDCQCPTHLKLLESCGTDGVTYPNYICRTNCAPPGVHQACLGMCPCKGKTTTGAHTKKCILHMLDFVEAWKRFFLPLWPLTFTRDCSWPCANVYCLLIFRVHTGKPPGGGASGKSLVYLLLNALYDRMENGCNYDLKCSHISHPNFDFFPPKQQLPPGGPDRRWPVRRSLQIPGRVLDAGQKVPSQGWRRSGLGRRRRRRAKAGRGPEGRQVAGSCWVWQDAPCDMPTQ